MLSLIIHLVLGIAVIVAIVASNPQIFRQPATPKVSVLEAVYYVAGIAATVLGYYFNHQYVTEYSQGNPQPDLGRPRQLEGIHPAGVRQPRRQ